MYTSKSQRLPTAPAAGNVTSLDLRGDFKLPNFTHTIPSAMLEILMATAALTEWNCNVSCWHIVVKNGIFIIWNVLYYSKILSRNEWINFGYMCNSWELHAIRYHKKNAWSGASKVSKLSGETIIREISPVSFYLPLEASGEISRDEKIGSFVNFGNILLPNY